MSPQEVSKIITDEIGEDWKRSNWHGCDLWTCLVTPERQMCADFRDEGQTREMWLVLVGHPDTHPGYKIVFDEETRQFGLAIEGSGGRDVWIGHYGTFIQTFDGM